MKIYLAGPINGCTDAQANDWRTEAKRIAAARGHTCLDPMARDYRGKEMEVVDDIVLGDKADIQSCGGVLLYFERPSVGTAQEELFAWERGIPVAVVNVSGKPPSPWLVYHAAAMTKTIEDGIAALETVRWPTRRINVYTHQFSAYCPVNDAQIDYTLQIETTGAQIMVEDIVREVGDAPWFHEQLADHLYARLAGKQTLKAHHHGVDIETFRG